VKTTKLTRPANKAVYVNPNSKYDLTNEKKANKWLADHLPYILHSVTLEDKSKALNITRIDGSVNVHGDVTF